MTITGLNPRYHVATGFDSSNIYSGTFPEDTTFSAFAAIQVVTADLVDGEFRQIMGTFLAGVGGWAIGRVPTINPNEFAWSFLTYDGVTTTEQLLDGFAAGSLYRNIMLGIDVAEGDCTVRVNGVTMLGTASPLLALPGFQLGGDAASGFGTREGLICAGYRSGANFTTAEWELLFSNFRRTNALNGPDMPDISHLYRTMSLVPQEGLQTAPLQWQNDGSAGVAGLLTRPEGGAVLNFTDDNNPAFTTAQLQAP